MNAEKQNLIGPRAKIVGLAATGLLVGVLMSGAAQAAVSVPVSTQAAIAFDLHRQPLWLTAQLLPCLVAFLVLFTGLGARIRAFCARAMCNNWFGTVTLFACSYVLLGSLVIAPFDYYRDVIDIRAWGEFGPSAVSWLIGEAVGMVVKLVAAALFVWIPYALIARFPRRWWLYSAVALVPIAFLILVVIPVWVSPLTTHYKLLDNRALEAKIEALAARCGVSHIPVFVGGNEDTVVGLGPTNRIVLDGDIFKNETPDQVQFTVGHELKHYIEGDNWKALAIIAVLLLSGLFLCDFLGRLWITRSSQRFGFDSFADPASLPMIILILSVFWLTVSPLFNLFARHIESEADRFGLELTHQNRPMGEIFANNIRRDGQLSDWDGFFRIFRATHPSNAERIRFSNDYHPWTKGESLAYGDVCKPAAPNKAARP